MVVEDSPVQREHAVSLCRQLGIELIYEACHGAEALQQLDMLQLKPDLMLIDLNMPIMDGVELITQMHEKGWKIPMLVVSSQQLSILNAVQDLSSTLSLPMLGSLPKPMRLEQLESALQHYSQCKQ
ncbi:MAG: response regulator, partial [Comamonadaceae bacterium]|nr:response regulator [Comamonadaceae bacterium]